MPQFTGMSQTQADAFRNGAQDAYGNAPEVLLSDGDAPCRCCLKYIPDSAEMLVLAYRPFTSLQPYAETGPVFLCKTPCKANGTGLPDIATSPEYLLKAYSADERIIYGTGRITPLQEIATYAETLLEDAEVAFVDLRSARNNCWQARISRTNMDNETGRL